MKPITNQLDVDTNHLSNNFLFIYNSVTSVLRDRGIIWNDQFILDNTER